MMVEIAGGVALAGLATWAGFESMWPTLHAYGRSFVGLESGSRKLALTYDDGPNDPHTLRLIEVLARHEVKATFFVLGQFVEQKPEIARALASAGHTIGNHSWDHPRLIFASNAELRRQVEQTQAAIVDACGVTPTLFRPPYGGRRPGTLSAIRKLGLEPVMWNVTCYDWKATSAARVFAHAQRQIRGGDVILLHDGDQAQMGADRSHTVAATDRLIGHYKAEGYEFVTVPEMMGKQSAVSR
ncbi:MAG TPA: polysaccharide deacetylase family protein [Candidatus Eisenbacteria bacterium]|nr:polysaccharide deacetylase family protein [Candidatus Eisenbacteria bacterium]